MNGVLAGQATPIRNCVTTAEKDIKIRTKWKVVQVNERYIGKSSPKNISKQPKDRNGH